MYVNKEMEVSAQSVRVDEKNLWESMAVQESRAGLSVEASYV